MFLKVLQTHGFVSLVCVYGAIHEKIQGLKLISRPSGAIKLKNESEK